MRPDFPIPFWLRPSKVKNRGCEPTPVRVSLTEFVTKAQSRREIVVVITLSQ